MAEIIIKKTLENKMFNLIPKPETFLFGIDLENYKTHFTGERSIDLQLGLDFNIQPK